LAKYLVHIKGRHIESTAANALTAATLTLITIYTHNLN